MTRETGTTGTEFPTRTDSPFLKSTPCRTPDETLGRHLLETVMTPAQVHRFRYAPGLSVVIEAPTPAWVAPLRSAAVAMADWHLVVSNDGIRCPSSEAAADETPITQALASGHRLVAVSHAPGRLLPSVLVARADMSIRTGHPTSAVIRMAIRDATDVEPGITSESLGDRLDYFDLVSAIRVGSDVRSCLRRLGSATANRAVVDRFPSCDTDPTDLHGYGEAAAWSERLIADVEAWRRGEIADFADPGRQAVLCGPDGTGRSSLVAAIARSAGLPLIATRVPSWLVDGNSYPDRVPLQAEVAFARAADASPAILLIDAIDAIPSGAAVGHVGRFLDGIALGGPSSPRLIVVGTASFGDAVDPGLVRPGRFSRIIEIPPPDDEAIPGILRQHLDWDLDGVCLGDVVALASGSTGGTLAGWVRDARRRARAARRPMAIEDLVAEASAPGNRAPGSWRRCRVRETFRINGLGATRGHSSQAISLRKAVGRGGRTGAASPQDEVGRKGRSYRGDHRDNAGRTGERDRTWLRRGRVQEIRNPRPRSFFDETHRPSFAPLISGASATHASSLRTRARGSNVIPNTLHSRRSFRPSRHPER
ncbi:MULTISPECIES: ATP-binding protein [unclassified Methylobacterium]|uniref:ATP-binding protein n=1 Tax=unclassified Methylobacterium TaxID=2615210 RepID=UPI00226ABA8A|nr:MULTISPECIES: ATP-binding protein [unclassified Methylobacterium]